MKKKTYSIMESQHNLAHVLREVAAGYEIQITRRKVPVARVLPIDDQEKVIFPDFSTRAQGVWQGAWSGQSSDALLDESRGSR